MVKKESKWTTSKKVEYLLLGAWVMALIATLGSLYFSEIQRYVPCELCWIQRIFMYPLVITLGIATVKKDAKQAYYTLPLTVIGMGVALYHYAVQKLPFLAEAGESCGYIPCHYEYINLLGFITLPFLSLTAFVIISILMMLTIKTTRSDK
ncbi:disulfide oxidoreductase [Salipaludibacillus sp. LMS25]|jgi:disulfide bond formation protein DsbB|uniref:disulfide oxidoreductase n=1 Tax=Salipaludibacillus sp. LMS25 TaxID=2924031 RepID=UPI0020D02EB4|nr:disulfide oxidoreductase [Salipaludibacillus sp. LMS25]UTR15436.1 disulfide oxidoreductase [Salipaludibacillus sp. LMS25]